MHRTLKERMSDRVVITSATLVTLVTAGCSQSPGLTAPVLNPEGVPALLNVMDAIALVHAGFEDATQHFRALSDVRCELLLAGTRWLDEQRRDVTTSMQVMPKAPPGSFRVRRRPRAPVTFRFCAQLFA